MISLQRTLTALILLGICSSSLLYGSSKHSRKTYLATRPQGVNAAMEYTTWHRHAYKKTPKIRTHLQVVPFYQKSQEGDEIGKYFGIGNQKNSFKVGSNDALIADNVDIRNNLLIHDATHENNSALRGTVTFDPEQEVWGSRFDLFQELDCLLNNVYFKVSAPLVHVANDMGMQITDPTNAVVQAEPVGPTDTEFSLEDFFKGNVSISAAGSTNLQSPLQKAKIAGRRTATGIADIDLSLGYKLYDKERCHIFLSVDGTIPTGNTVRGDYLFEPIYGNGRHWALGGSLDAGATLWDSCSGCYKVRLLGTAHYKYLFEATENRTLSLNFQDGNLKNAPLGHYFLIGRNGQQNLPLFPAANILTQPLDITPGNMVDSMIMLAFHAKSFTFDLGYNLFWREHETVHLKQDFIQPNTFGVANPIYQTNAVFDFAMGARVTQIISPKDINLNAVTTPSLLTHKIFAGLGYTSYKDCENIYSLGIGGSYEFASTNVDLENFALWLKACFSF